MNGVNMNDYFPIKNSYNPVVYMHKKFLPKDGMGNGKLGKEDVGQKSFTQNFKEIKNTRDKSEQYDSDKVRTETYRTKVINNNVNKDPLVEQTIKFAKDIIPLTIPPSTNVLAYPIYYTVNPSKKTKRKHESRQQNFEHDKDATFNKQTSKTAIKTVYKEKYKCPEESFCARESVSRSSKNNTSDDLNQNKSLCCSSESSEQKNFNKEENQKKTKRNAMQNIKASESFEAITTEYMNTSSDAKIKLYLMNDKEKQLLYENIRAPVLKVIKQCFSELDNHNEVNLDLQYVHTAIQKHENKLECILGKLDRIEKKLDLFGRNISDVPNTLNKKSSQLEDLGKDLDIKDDISSEEELAEVNLSKKRRGNTAVINVASVRDEGRVIGDHLAKGENGLQDDETSSSQVGINPDRLKRIPARYCWTDAAKKN